MSEKVKITKRKGVQIVVDMIYRGMGHTEIYQELAKTYKLHERTAAAWQKAAKPLVQARFDADERARQEENDRLTKEAAEKNNVTKERLIKRLSEIVFGNPSELFTVDGGLKPISDWTSEQAGMIAGIESFDQKPAAGGEVIGTNRKIKILNPIEAAKLLADICGYKAPVKSEVTEKKLRIGYAKPGND